MKKINVLQLIDSLDVGGAEVLAVNTCNLLNQTNMVNSFLATTRKEGDLFEKVDTRNYIFLQRKNTIDIRAVLSLRKYLLSNQIQIIHAHASSYFFAFCVKLTLPSIKIIWHDHFGNSDYLTKRAVQPLKFISNFMVAIIVVNSKLLRWGRSKLNQQNIHLLNNFAHFSTTSAQTLLNGEAGKRIVMTAAFRPQKDHLNLLKAFEIIHNAHPEWTLHLIGENHKDSYGNSITNYIETSSIESAVFTYGARKDISNILKQTTIGVLSSKSEGLPLALLEYGLAKLPVVATDVGECKKLIGNNDAGLLVPKENPSLLADAVLKLVNSKKSRKDFAEAIYKRVNNRYSKEQYIDQLCEIYSKALW